MFFTSENQSSMQLSHGAKSAYAGDERRGEHRRRILKGALLQFNNGFGSLECVLRDLSSDGSNHRCSHPLQAGDCRREDTD